MTMAKKDTQQEKVYITRDEDDDFIWIWRKTKQTSWEPTKLKDCDAVNYQRENRSLDNTSFYLVKDFKKKFGITIRQKSKKSIKLPVDLLDSEDYKLISDDPKRKQ